MVYSKCQINYNQKVTWKSQSQESAQWHFAIRLRLGAHIWDVVPARLSTPGSVTSESLVELVVAGHNWKKCGKVTLNVTFNVTVLRIMPVMKTQKTCLRPPGLRKKSTLGSDLSFKISVLRSGCQLPCPKTIGPCVKLKLFYVYCKDCKCYVHVQKLFFKTGPPKRDLDLPKTDTWTIQIIQIIPNKVMLF